MTLVPSGFVQPGLSGCLAGCLDASAAGAGVKWKKKREMEAVLRVLLAL